MQLTAPSSSLAPQAGHAVGVAGCWGLGGGGGAGLDGAGARAACPAPAAAPTSCGAAWGCAVNVFLQNGQRNCLPGESSPSCILLLQCGQLITIGMACSRPSSVAASLPCVLLASGGPPEIVRLTLRDTLRGLTPPARPDKVEGVRPPHP